MEFGERQEKLVDFLESTNMNVMIMNQRRVGTTTGLVMYCINCRHNRMIWYCGTNRERGLRMTDLCEMLDELEIECRREHDFIKFGDKEVLFSLYPFPGYDVCIIDLSISSLVDNGQPDAPYTGRKEVMKLLTTEEYEDYRANSMRGKVKNKYIRIALSRLADKNMRLIAVTHDVEFHSIFKDNPVMAIEFMFESNFVLYSS
jgi:hypothetical protein